MTTLTAPVSGRSVLDQAEIISINELVNRSADFISPTWPLKNFIAVNPLQGLEHLPFDMAVLENHRLRGVHAQASDGQDVVNREMIKWCTVFFDEGQATISMPDRELGFYRSFRSLAPFDASLNRSRRARQILLGLPESPEDAIAGCLMYLGIIDEHKEEFIRQALTALPGWSGYVKWKEDWQNPTDSAKFPANLVDFVAVRLVLTRLLCPKSFNPNRPLPQPPAFLNELPERENRFQQELIDRLLPEAKLDRSPEVVRPDAQLVFCIDVRSEPFRRAIEAQGNYATLGFAGFFGVPVKVETLRSDQGYDSCPVLIKPRHTVCDRIAASNHPNSVRLHQRVSVLSRMPKTLYQWLKYNFATPYALVEMLGPWLGLRMLGRTFMPGMVADISQKADEHFLPKIFTEPILDEIELETQVDFAESALRMMGLTENLASLVVFCGHGSHTTNNAYASALDCGACGGNQGGNNAKILAAILNSQTVRDLLSERGLEIPVDTLFVAAQHNTTTDDVELYSPQTSTEVQRKRLNNLVDDLSQAQIHNAKYRSGALGLKDLSGDRVVREIRRRSNDWAEVRPEWGLARNAAFIVGARSLTQSIDLQGRCFLHSYNWKNDPTGQFLTTILTAPMVVAQWINSQYFFSTLDNVAFGSGSKITQNVTGKIGVMQGNSSDLMHGLPLQSVFASDRQPYHEPLRLLTVVHAPRTRLESIVQEQEVLKKLFGNGWVHLVCIDPIDHSVYRLNRDLSWAKERSIA